MGDYAETFNTICRLCLQHDKTAKMVSIYDNSGEKGLSIYGAFLEKFIKIPAVQNECLPTKICAVCTKSLEDLTAFLLRCETTEKKLSKLNSFNLHHKLTGELGKEVILQYTMFSQQFPEESKPTTSRASTSRFEEDIKLLTKENHPNIEESCQSNIKVQNMTQNQSDSDEDLCEDVTSSNENVSQSDSDHVDKFIVAFEELSKIKHDKDSRKTENELVGDKKAKVPEHNLTCNICLKTLANPATYDYHMQRHGVCRYICDQCGKGFPVLAEMTHHQIYRHGIGPCLECDHCSFKAAKRIEMIEHMRLHTGERPFICEKCGQSFRRKAIYNNHLKCHDEKTISCDHCPRKFYRRGEMLAHSNNVHDRLYLYLCQVCKVTYAKSQTVRRHMLIEHGIAREMQGKIVRINRNGKNTLFDVTKFDNGEFNL